MARRTVHTLMGSYVALSTSTRPPDQRPAPSGLGPCRGWSPGGTDPSGPGGTAVAMTCAECSYGADGNEPSTRTPSAWERSAPIAWATGGSSGAAVEVDEEHVVPEPAPPRARLDAGQVDLAVGELGQAAHEPARRGRRSAPRTSARSSRRRRRRGRAPRGAIHTKRVSEPRRVLDVRGEHRAAVELGGGAAPERRPRLAVLALGDQAHGVRGRGGGHHRGARQAGAQEAWRTGRWPAGARPRRRSARARPARARSGSGGSRGRARRRSGRRRSRTRARRASR